jgi:hypothetical protein
MQSSFGRAARQEGAVDLHGTTLAPDESSKHG